MWQGRMSKAEALQSAEPKIVPLPLARAKRDDETASREAFSPPIRDECAELIRRADNAETAQQVLPRLKHLLSRFPDELDTNLAHALVTEMTRVREGMLELWTEVHERFPGNFKAFQYRLRWLSRLRRVSEGLDILEKHYPSLPLDVDARLNKAELLTELREIAGARQVFDSILSDFPDAVRGPVQYAKRLRDWGELDRAVEVLAPVVSQPHAPKAAIAMSEELQRGLATLDRLASDWRSAELPSYVTVLQCAIGRFADRFVSAIDHSRLGSVTLITGSLGTGGAERQLARTAARLERARRIGSDIASRQIRGPVQVVVKSLAHDGNHDFFLPMIASERVESYQIDNMKPVPHGDLTIADEDLRCLLPFIPAHANYGVQRLVQHFRANRTEVAYIWQDGAVLFAALAALIAGVPRIVLNVRGLPPILRPHLYRAEYGAMYKALAGIPGVEFMSNSVAVARAYCDWLDLPATRFAVVYNGVERLPPDPAHPDEERWSAFEKRTADATETIGGVFRIDIDKRPELWIEFACQYYRRHPRARFVLVGSGPLFARVRQQASDLGIADRILFVGRSSTVGYWLTKMDALVLLSRFEGLPNVLIEAQMAGIPVVSTPAGGACEAFVHGVTGLAADTVENVDIESLCRKVMQIVVWSLSNRYIQSSIRQIASEKFSTQSMVEKTVRVLTGGTEAEIPDSGILEAV